MVGRQFEQINRSFLRIGVIVCVSACANRRRCIVRRSTLSSKPGRDTHNLSGRPLVISMLASPRSYSQVRKRSYWVSLNDRLTDYLPAHPPGQQRREISEDHAKLNELRSSCKIREESYKVEIEKLRLKLERIRHRF